MTRLRRRLRDDRGITLVEILIATVIIGVGLVGLAIVIPLSSYGVHEGNALSTATFLAEQRLEEVRNAAWTITPTANDCLGTGSPPTSSTCARTVNPEPATVPNCTNGTACETFRSEAAVGGYPGYARSVSITSCDPGPCAGVTNSNMRLVRVTVTYTPITGVGAAPAGSGKSAVLELIVTRRE